MSWKSDKCILCDFLFQCINFPDISASQMNAAVGLHNRDLNDFRMHMGIIAHALDTLGLEQGYTFCHLSGVESFISFLHTPCDLSLLTKITPSKIDFDLVRIWLQKSTNEEILAAQPHCSSHVSPNDVAVSQHGISALTVVDCVSRTLIPLPSHGQYVTLSYVWGPNVVGVDQHYHDKTRLPRLPRTIEDSIIVCLAIGLRYLWVDRYCIPQSDPIERQKQIESMGEIYQNSSLTVVACAGKDPQYGLPGVTNPQKNLPSLFDKAIGYLQVIPLVDAINESVWASRAWTYQETLLSRRRHYFTDHQLYFESSTSVDCEWSTLTGFDPIISDNLWIHSGDTWLQEPHDIYKCIRDFTRRRLSFQSDALNAMLGIFEVFEKKFKVRHLWGLPYLDIHCNAFPTIPERSPPTFQSGLSFDYVFEPQRREEFPSWSWAGWTGTDWTGVPHWPIHPEQCQRKNEFRVVVELDSGDLISLEDYQKDYEAPGQRHRRLGPFIHIHAHMSRISRLTEGDPVDRFATTIIELADGTKLKYTEFNRKSPWLIDKIRGCLDQLLLIHFPTSIRNARIPQLLVHNIGEHHWERVAGFEWKYVYRTNDVVIPGNYQMIRLG